MKQLSRHLVLSTHRCFSLERWVGMSVFLVLSFLLASTGCKKKAEPVAQSIQDSNPVVVVDQAPTPTSIQQPANPQAPPLVQADGQPDLGELKRDVIRWIVRNRRRPNNFEDFAATAGVPIPPPPAGKKYVLTQDMHVTLADR